MVHLPPVLSLLLLDCSRARLEFCKPFVKAGLRFLYPLPRPFEGR
jgi:hypothetical protein